MSDDDDRKRALENTLYLLTLANSRSAATGATGATGATTGGYAPAAGRGRGAGGSGAAALASIFGGGGGGGGGFGLVAPMHMSLPSSSLFSSMSISPFFPGEFSGAISGSSAGAGLVGLDDDDDDKMPPLEEKDDDDDVPDLVENFEEVSVRNRQPSIFPSTHHWSPTSMDYPFVPDLDGMDEKQVDRLLRSLSGMPPPPPPSSSSSTVSSSATATARAKGKGKQEAFSSSSSSSSRLRASPPPPPPVPSHSPQQYLDLLKLDPLVKKHRATEPRIGFVDEMVTELTQFCYRHKFGPFQSFIRSLEKRPIAGLLNASTHYQAFKPLLTSEKNDLIGGFYYLLYWMRITAPAELQQMQHKSEHKSEEKSDDTKHYVLDKFINERMRACLKAIDPGMLGDVHRESVVASLSSRINMSNILEYLVYPLARYKHFSQQDDFKTIVDAVVVNTRMDVPVQKLDDCLMINIIDLLLKMLVEWHAESTTTSLIFLPLWRPTASGGSSSGSSSSSSSTTKGVLDFDKKQFISFLETTKRKIETAVLFDLE